MNAHKPQGPVRYRRMTADDLPAAHQLSQAALWPHRLEDWKFIHELGEGIVAENKSGIVGTVMCWLHGARYASIGMNIVAPDHRNLGIASELMTRILKEVGSRTTLLHTTSNGIALFEHFGFAPFGSIHRHQGTVFHTPFVALAEGERIRPVSPRDEGALAELAARSTGMPRSTVIKQLMTVAHAVAIDRYGELIAFAALRKFGLGYVIGPVVAPDIERAKALIAHWAGVRAGNFARVDVPGGSGLGPWLTDMGLVQVDETVTVMVRGEPPRPEASVTRFALLSQSLG